MYGDGFAIGSQNGQTTVDFLLPTGLESCFSVKLYCRGPLMDQSAGDPQKALQAIHGETSGMPLVAPYQVHGTAVIPARSIYAFPFRPQADGIFLNERSNAAASLRFADCTPIVIAGEHPAPWMLLLHSGYAGTVKNIAGVSLQREKKRNGIIVDEKTWAWIAPSICRKCYSRKKNGDPSTAAGMIAFSEKNFDETKEYVFFDIKAQIAAQLRQAGLAQQNIFIMDACTFCEPTRFYSYRAGDAQARNFLLARTTKNHI